MKSPRTDIPHHYMYDNLQMVQQYILHLGTPSTPRLRIIDGTVPRNDIISNVTYCSTLCLFTNDYKSNMFLYQLN